MKRQLGVNWEEIESYATVTHLKKQLTKRAKRQRLSDSMRRTYRYWLTKFFKFTTKTPDKVVELALKDSDETESLLIDFEN